MNKVKTLLSVVVALSMLVSCGDDIDDLDKRLDIVEEGLGADEPIKATFTTTDDDDEEVVEKGPFIFERNKWDAVIFDKGNTNYDVRVYRYPSLELGGGEGSEGLYLTFEFNANIKEVTESDVELIFYDKKGSVRYTNFNTLEDNVSLTVTVKSFKPQTGEINLTFEGSSTASYEGNAYEGKPMTIKGSFKGKLPILID